MATLTEDKPAEGAQDTGPATGVTPHLTTPDALRAIDFYHEAFGAELAFKMLDDSGRVLHAHLKLNNGSVFLHDDFPEYRGGLAAPKPESICLHLKVDNADRWFERAVNAGAVVEAELQNMFWGDRYGRVRDPWGYVWAIAHPLKPGETDG